MARKIDLTVNVCKECPHCHFESEIGEHFCTGHSIGLSLDEGMDVRKAIHIDCPLPWVKEEVVPTTYACGALQMQELSECPEDWIRQVIAEEEAYDERRRRDVDLDVEKMFGAFDENDESWDKDK